MNIHKKSIGLLNVNGFYDSLLTFLDKAMEMKFMSLAARKILVSASTIEELLDKLQTFEHIPDPVVQRIGWSRKGGSTVDLTLRL